MAGTPTELVSGIVTRYSSPEFRFDVCPRDSHLARGSVRRCVLASREWVLICLLSGFLGDTDDDARRNGGSCHVSADEFDRATWRARRTLLDRLQRIGASWLRGFRAHNVAYADDTFTQYKGAQASAMDQAAHHARSCEVVQMLARLAETRAAHEHGSDPEFTIDQMIERDTGGHDVAARVGSSELDSE